MAGFFQPPGAIVNEIKNLLKGRYKKGFPIIKEIIQNANDGQALALDFGIIKGLRFPVDHPLLKDPALFFLNDGNFSKADQGAICQFGMDSKSGDKGKIGKFGLGQKSVFHFCEAFFYIARSDDIPEGCGAFINPWQPPTGIDPKRPDWIELTDHDRQVLERFVISQGLVDSENLRYFLLWIPLRQSTEDGRYILSNLYDASSIESDLPPDMDLQIAQILPSLRHLEKVSYWIQNDVHELNREFNVSLRAIEGERLERCRYPKNDHSTIYLTPDTYTIEGISHINARNLNIEFGGKERILPASQFISLIDNGYHYSQDSFWSELEASQHWPRRQTADEYGESHDEPDKVLPHCAVIFSRRKKQNSCSTFTAQWAVFLPVAGRDQEEQIEFFECKCDGEYDYSLLLHGYFFLDSGRKYIEALTDILNNNIKPQLPETEEELNRQWNYILATQGTLRLILTALKEFTESHQLQAQEISHLSRGLINCFEKSNREYLYSDYQWIYRLHPIQTEWLLLDTNSRTRYLPASPPSWDAFPLLKDLAERDYLILDGYPNLKINRTEDKWESHEVATLIKSLDPLVIFSEPKYLSYLNDFLGTIDNIQNSEIQEQLCLFLKKSFRVVDLEKLQEKQYHDLIKKSVRYVESQRRFKIHKISDSKVKLVEVNEILERLFQLDLSCLLVYDNFDPETTSKGILDEESATKFLVIIAEIIQKSPDCKQQKITNRLLDQLLALDVVHTALSKNPELKIIHGYSYLKQQFEIYSLSELKDLKKTHRLLKTSLELEKDPWAIALQTAIADQSVVVIHNSRAKDLGKILDGIYGCDHKGCQWFLSALPKLADASSRVALLKHLGSNLDMDEELRYLLHGNSDNYDDHSSLYYIPLETENNAFWEKLGKQILNNHNESWRILNLDLVQILPQTIHKQLGIESLTAESVIKKIEQSYEDYDQNCLDTTNWSDQDYNQLLDYLFRNDKPKLWKGLALHKNSKGNYVTIIDGRTFLTSDKASYFRCPKKLEELVTLIPSNSNVQRGQEVWIQPWSAYQALLILLVQDEPHQYFISILEVLEQVPLDTICRQLRPDDAASIKKQIKEIPWLCTKAGDGISINQIIQVPQSLNHHQSVILSVMEGKPISDLDKSVQTYEETYKWLKRQIKVQKELDILSKILKVLP